LKEKFENGLEPIKRFNGMSVSKFPVKMAYNPFYP